MTLRSCHRCGHDQAHDDCFTENPETLFGFTVWAHMIPPFCPKDVLILGECYITLAPLIRKIWGTEISICFGNASTQFKSTFECVCIDLWDGREPTKIIFMPEFVLWLKELAPRMICANVPRKDMLRLQRNLCDHGPFRFERADPVGDNVVLWWSAKS